MKNEKINLALFYGGRSGEHEVSCVSAAYVLSNLVPEKYNVFPVWIDHAGHARFIPEADARRVPPVGSLPTGGSPCRFSNRGGRVALEAESIEADIDFAFPVLHGSYGEDGRIQGFFDTLDLPYAGSGVCGSALAMDKILTKQVATALGIPQAPYVALHAHEYRADPEGALAEIRDRLKYPIFAKPANLGSSVGITKARDEQALRTAVEHALEFDRRIILEQGLEIRELETGMLGNADNVQTSVIGEVIVYDDFYSYRAKYQDDEASSLAIPADIPPAIAEQMRDIVIRMYRALNCAGYARADVFYAVAEERIYFNEINTIPGFTPISMFPRLWKHSGIDGPELTDAIVRLGFELHEQIGRLKYKYDSAS